MRFRFDKPGVGCVYACISRKRLWQAFLGAVSSAGSERYVHTVEVGGSNPLPPTISAFINHGYA